MTHAAAIRSITDWTKLRCFLAIQRQTLGLTLAEVGDQCGVSRQTVDNWEAGKQMPIAANLFMWAAALGVRLVDVAEDRG